MGGSTSAGALWGHSASGAATDRDAAAQCCGAERWDEGRGPQSPEKRRRVGKKPHGHPNPPRVTVTSICCSPTSTSSACPGSASAATPPTFLSSSTTYLRACFGALMLLLPLMPPTPVLLSCGGHPPPPTSPAGISSAPSAGSGRFASGVGGLSEARQKQTPSTDNIHLAHFLCYARFAWIVTTNAVG